MFTDGRFLAAGLRRYTGGQKNTTPKSKWPLRLYIKLGKLSKPGGSKVPGCC